MSEHDPLAELLSEVPENHDVTSWPGHGYTCEWCGPLDATDAIWHCSDRQAAAARAYIAGEIESAAEHPNDAARQMSPLQLADMQAVIRMCAAIARGTA